MPDQLSYHVSDLQYGDLFSPPQIYRAHKIFRACHQSLQGLHHVIDIAKRSRLTAIAIHRERAPGKGLRKEIRHHSAIVRRHAGTISIEDTGNLHPRAPHPLKFNEQGFCTALTLVVAGARPNRVHIAVVILVLRMLLRIAIDFAGGRLQDSGVAGNRQLQQVVRAEHAGAQGENGIFLITLG